MMIATKPTKKHETFFWFFVADNTTDINYIAKDLDSRPVSDIEYWNLGFI
jgi:hypothetical protein